MHLPPRNSLFVVLVLVGEYVLFYAAGLLSQRPHPRDGGKASLEVRSHLLTLEREENTVNESCARAALSQTYSLQETLTKSKYMKSFPLPSLPQTKG